MLTIFHMPRSRSVRVVWLCEEMGLPYRISPVSFDAPSDEFTTANPLRSVPAMIDGDVAMMESPAMLIYLASKYGGDVAVAPSDPAYAAFLQFIVFGEASIAAQAGLAAWTMFRGPDNEKSNFTTGLIDAHLTSRLAYLGKHLEGREFLAADRFTAADVSVSFGLNLLAFGQRQHLMPPNLAAYHQRMLERPAYKRASAA